MKNLSSWQYIMHLMYREVDVEEIRETWSVNFIEFY